MLSEPSLPTEIIFLNYALAATKKRGKLAVFQNVMKISSLLILSIFSAIISDTTKKPQLSERLLIDHPN